MSKSRTPQEKHPELFMRDMNADPRKRKRTVPMQVLSLGMPRTGTASMQSALNILGIPCYHGFTLMFNLRDTEMWNDALNAKYFGKGQRFTREDWDQLLGPYAAVTDLPAIAFPEDLIEAYPEAKVILVERDIEKWYQSFYDAVILNVWSPMLHIIAKFDVHHLGRMESTSVRWTTGWMGSNSKQEMEQKARAKYREHNALIRKVTPPDRLLEFDLRGGWKPLCTFLNKPLPDVPFPHTNETEALKEKINIIAIRGARNAFFAIAKVILLPLIGSAVWILYTRMGSTKSE